MPADYPDPGDAPGARRPSDGTPPPGDRQRIEVPAAPADPAAREAIHRAHWARVERAEAAAAREAWSRAVPEFRATWEAHLARYPDRGQPTPRNHPDGSWSCGETRRLSPDQNAEASRGYARVRDVGERDIVPGILAVEAADPSRQLAGFEHHIKGEDRLKEKIADRIRVKGRTPAQALAEIPDAVRFTYQYQESGYTAGVREDVKRLEERGFTQVERRNTWDDDQYKGINARWREPTSGALFEVQFHTQASLEAKELTHKAYERIRSTARDDERAELKEFQRRVNSMIPIPPGALEIEDYPPGET